jgi:hypothetical protein
MSSQAIPAPAPNRRLLWAGRVLSALPVLVFAMSASMKLTASAQVVQGLTEKAGYPAGTITPIGMVELLCAVLYVVPQTSVLGAVLLTGYLGGAVATHVRIGEPFLAPVLVGVLVWAGLFLRDERIRALVPVRKPV